MIVSFLLGSKDNLDHAKKITTVLEDYNIPYEVYVASAHKVPEKTLAIVNRFNEMKESVVFVTIAGRSNALSGLVSGHTHFPVIACPTFEDKADYLTNIHSTLQTPSEAPSMTVLDPENAGQAVVRLLALNNKDLAKKIKNHIKVVQHAFTTDPLQFND